MRRNFAIVIALGLLMGATFAHGTFLRSVGVVVKPGNGRSYVPLLHRDSKGVVYLAWTDGRREKFDLYLARSLDGGRNWSPEETWIDAAKPPEVESTTLALAEGKEGALHAVWQSTYGETDVRVKHAVSRDRGATWSSSQPLNGSPGLGYEPKIVSDRAGHLYVTWYEQRPSKEPPQEKLGFKLTAPQEFDVFFTRSDDDGKSWLTPVRLNPRASSPTSFRPQIADGGKGNLYILWEEREAGQVVPGVYIAASPDHGATWPVRGLKLNRGQREAVDAHLAGDSSGHVYAVWNDFRQGAASVYFSASSDHGRTWLSQDIRLGSTAPGTGPVLASQIAVSESGRVFVTWIDTRNSTAGLQVFSRGDVFLTRSDDYGKTWLAHDVRLNTPVPGSSQIQTQQIVTDPTGRLVAVAWSDGRAGKEGIYLTLSTDRGRTWLKKEVQVDQDARPEQTGHAPALLLTSDGWLLVAWEVGRKGESLPQAGPALRDIRIRRIEIKK